MSQNDLFRLPKKPWNAGRLVGPKAPLKPKHIWAIRQQLKTARRRVRITRRASGGPNSAPQSHRLAAEVLDVSKALTRRTAARGLIAAPLKRLKAIHLRIVQDEAREA